MLIQVYLGKMGVLVNLTVCYFRIHPHGNLTNDDSASHAIPDPSKEISRTNLRELQMAGSDHSFNDSGTLHHILPPLRHLRSSGNLAKTN